MSKAAEVAVLALRDLAWVKVAKFGFVLLAVVETLHAVVGPLALVAFRALFCLGKLAELWGVDPILSSLVFVGVEEVAGLVVVSHALRGAFQPLELVQKEVPDQDELSCLVAYLLHLHEDLHVRGGPVASGSSQCVLGIVLEV